MRARSLAPWLLAAALTAACGADGNDGGASGTGGTGNASGSGGSSASGGTSGTGGLGATGGVGASGGIGGSCTGYYTSCEGGKIVSGTCDICVSVDCDMPGNYVGCSNNTCVYLGQTCPDADAGLDAADDSSAADAALDGDVTADAADSAG